MTSPPTAPRESASTALTRAPAPVRPAHPRWSTSARWTITAIATVVSTLALDIVATTTGVLLAASHALDEASHGLTIGFLALTYAFWVSGLWFNLIANGRLLEQTGTSTNLPSKVLFELARVRSCSQRCARAAAAAGYLVTELAKEAPYYAGAFGAALVSETVDARTALIFLAGTNIGAALYEYFVGRLSRNFLHRRSQRVVGSPPTAGKPLLSQQFDRDESPSRPSARGQARAGRPRYDGGVGIWTKARCDRTSWPASP